MPMKECCAANGDNFLKGWIELQSVWGQGLKCMGTGTGTGIRWVWKTVCDIVIGLNFSVSNNMPAQNEFLGTKHNSHLRS